MCLALSRCENIEGHGRVKKPKGRKKKFRVHFLFSPYIILCATLRRPIFFLTSSIFPYVRVSNNAGRFSICRSMFFTALHRPVVYGIHTTGKRLSYSDWKNEKRNREGSQRIFLYFSLSLSLSLCVAVCVREGEKSGNALK
jgi:hypothetical protein